MSDPLTIPKARCFAYVEGQRMIEETRDTIAEALRERLTRQHSISPPDAQQIAQEVIAKLFQRAA